MWLTASFYWFLKWAPQKSTDTYFVIFSPITAMITHSTIPIYGHVMNISTKNVKFCGLHSLFFLNQQNTFKAFVANRSYNIKWNFWTWINNNKSIKLLSIYPHLCEKLWLTGDFCQIYHNFSYVSHKAAQFSIHKF